MRILPSNNYQTNKNNHRDVNFKALKVISSCYHPNEMEIAATQASALDAPELWTPLASLLAGTTKWMNLRPDEKLSSQQIEQLFKKGSDVIISSKDARKTEAAYERNGVKGLYRSLNALIKNAQKNPVQANDISREFMAYFKAVTFRTKAEEALARAQSNVETVRTTGSKILYPEKAVGVETPTYLTV